VLFVFAVLSTSTANADVNKEATLTTADDRIFRNAVLEDDRATKPGDFILADTGIEARPEQVLLSAAAIGRISSGFGLRSDPLGPGIRMHTGIDIPKPQGTPVRATRSGQVRFSGWAGNYGNLVEIAHGNSIVTRYAHLLRRLVAKGQPVATGTVIGLVGSTGNSTGNHLHYEVRLSNRAVNPLTRSGMAAPFGSAKTANAYLPPNISVVTQSTSWTDPRATHQLPIAILRRSLDEPGKTPSISDD
jgi:murein DD-endopeptidase MepM/ murein hydrolase activator NlpD